MKIGKHFLKSLIFTVLLVNIACVKAETGDIDMNIKAIKAIQENNQAESLYYFNMAKAYEKEKSVDKAIESYKLAIKENPDLGSAYSSLGLIYAEKGDYKNSIEIFKKYLNFSSDPEEEELIKQFINKMKALVKK